MIFVVRACLHNPHFTNLYFLCIGATYSVSKSVINNGGTTSFDSNSAEEEGGEEGSGQFTYLSRRVSLCLGIKLLCDGLHSKNR